MGSGFVAQQLLQADALVDLYSLVLEGENKEEKEEEGERGDVSTGDLTRVA